MEGDVNDTMLAGLAEFVVCSLNVSIGLTEKFDMDMRLASMVLNGKYDLNGLMGQLFPLYGQGDYRMEVMDGGFIVGAGMSYNPISDHAKIKDLHVDVWFDQLNLELECILGCGDMADIVNGIVSDMAAPIFNSVMSVVDPILCDALETGINAILKNISISDIIKPPQLRALEIGNANSYLDLTMITVRHLIKKNDMDPATLPSLTLDLDNNAQLEVYNGELTGLSSLHRTGTATMDRVADWAFLYANIGVKEIKAHYTGSLEVGNTGPVVEIDASIAEIAVYLVARADVYEWKFDFDQFEITEFGHIDVTVDGLGLFDYMLGPITEAVANSLHDTIVNLLETTVKEAIQQALNETPWTM